MRKAARKLHDSERDPYDVALTIVPTDFDDVLPFVPRRAPPTTPLPVERVERASTPVPPARVAAPRGSSSLVVAGAVGGGMVVGGGVVGLVAAALAAVAVVVVGAGVVAWLVTAPSPAPVAEVAAPVEVVAEAPATEATELPPEMVAEVPTPPATPVAAAAPRAPAPVQPKTTASPSPAATPQVPAAAAAATVVVKVITDPPAALLVVDGTPHGRTPAKLLLAPGAHTIGLESGKATGSFSVTVGSGGERFCYAADGKRVTASTCP